MYLYVHLSIHSSIDLSSHLSLYYAHAADLCASDEFEQFWEAMVIIYISR